ncbi:hypothetical protein CRYUN_Cryun25bG0117300 [Craigia yunnanensis]
MAGSQSGELKMEGWLYIIRSNRIGLQYSRKRYFVLEDHLLKSFKSIPISNPQVFFIFTLYNTSNHNDQLKLGASSPEEAARWIHSFQRAALKSGPYLGNDVACSKSRWQSFSFFEGIHACRSCGSSSANHNNSIDWTLYSSIKMDRVTSDVVAPSPWTIFGCQNGLRLFKEAKDRDSHGKWDDHPAIMAVGVVDGTSEAIFQTLMSLGPSRSEWDFCFYKGSVVEHLDGHTDIVHKQLYSDWLPWGMKRRDLLLRRYWRREDDGIYVILYHSVFHKKCSPQKSYVRACLKSGGYVISPVNEGKHSVVKHMLAIDWKFWKSYLRTSAARSITIRMLERVAALRELFKAKQGKYPSADLSSGEFIRNAMLHRSEEDGIVDMCTQIEAGKIKVNMSEGMERAASEHSSLVGLNDAADDFFDVPEPTDYDQSEDGWTADFGPEVYSQDTRHPKLSTAAVFVKKLHDLAVQKRGYMDLQDMTREDGICCSYGNTLPKEPTCTLPCSWTAAEPSTFLIRGENYLEDRKKFKAKGTLMQMVAADWLRSDKREDDLGGRPGGIVQKYAAQGGPEFFFIVNIQVPGSTTYSLALYYMMNTPVEDSPLLQNFINRDDAYRNSRFKLIPYISKGSWIVKQSVGKKACLIGQALEINYFHGKNYLELGIDIGSSTVARGVVSLVLGYLNNLVIEMAFLIQVKQHFLKKLYSYSLECPRSYDKLWFDPRLLVTHDDYSITFKLPRDRTSVVTILRNPIDLVFSTYEFSVEVAARFLVHPNLTSATQMIGHIYIYFYSYGPREARKARGTNEVKGSDPYNKEDIAMPLLDYINDPIAHGIVHNGATFQNAGLTNNSYLPESHEVRHCVGKYNNLGQYVLQIAKKRLDNMLYVGLTEDHRQSATMFSNVVGAKVISQLVESNAIGEGAAVNKSEQSTSFSDSELGNNDHQNPTSDEKGNETTTSSSDDNEVKQEKMTVGKLMETYEVCISSLRKTQARRHVTSLKRISPANFTKEARLQVPQMVLRRIQSLNNLDLELYEYAQGIFAKQHKQAAEKLFDMETLGSMFIYSGGIKLWDVCLWAMPFVLLFIFFSFVNAKRRTLKVEI